MSHVPFLAWEQIKKIKPITNTLARIAMPWFILSPHTLCRVEERRHDQSDKSADDGTRQTASESADPRACGGTGKGFFLRRENPLKLRQATTAAPELFRVSAGVCIEGSAVTTN